MFDVFEWKNGTNDTKKRTCFLYTDGTFELLGDRPWNGHWDIKRVNDTRQKLCFSGAKGYYVDFNFEDLNTKKFTKHSHGIGHKSELRTSRLIKYKR